jgi:molybdate transport system substrate-binding protein
MRHALVLGLALAAAACSSKPSDRKLRVAAASDLARAFAEIATEFKARTKIAVEIEFGSSGLLAKQIEQGAPFALFAAANRTYADQVVKAGRCDPATVRMYARGRLVVWTPNGVAPPAALADLADARFRRIAIANPEHAPYGRAARQALEQAGVWPQVKDRIVLGENIQATMLYARNGNADAAIVALALTVISDGGASLPVDPALHAPIDQAMVVCGQGEVADAAKQFQEFVLSREGREVMTRYGFQLPDGAPQARSP